MKPDRFWVNIFVIIILLCLAGMFFLSISQSRATDAHIAYIYSGGELIEIIDLNTVEETYTVTISFDDDRVNVLEVGQGRIRVCSADCAGGDCVRQGWVSGGAVPIVCLPHRLIIQIESGTNIDGVVG